MALNDHRNDAQKQRTTLSSTLVRCVCVTASFVATACALLGLGITCFVTQVTDPEAAPCPFHLTVTVFGVAGLLFSISFVLLLLLCRRRNKAELQDLPVACDAIQESSPPCESVNGGKKEYEDAPVTPTEPLPSDDVDHFAMTQKSADVSYWIEQQNEPNHPPENVPLEAKDGATGKISDQANSEDEMTAL